jgi:hypothetical protein
MAPPFFKADLAREYQVNVKELCFPENRKKVCAIEGLKEEVSGAVSFDCY